VDVSKDAAQPNWQPMPWTYAPLLLTSQTSPVTRNVTQVNAALASSVDMVGGEDGIHKEVLLATSSNSKTTGVPARVDLSFGVEDEQSFRYTFIPVALSLEGVFTSLYAYQLPPEQIVNQHPTRKQSVLTRQIVVAAGSAIRNEWQQGRPLPLGYDRYTQMQFGNRDFMVNAVLYLADEEGWMNLRQKEIRLRMINDQRARQSRVTAQVVSIVIPLLILGCLGVTFTWIRRRKYVK
jgi:ABC-2 type transport system permease protein